MQAWFEELIRDLIWKALNDLFADLSALAEAEIEARIESELVAGKQLSSSPLVRVLDADNTTVTLLIRGRIKLWKKAASAFMRIEAVVSKDIDLSAQLPITITDWVTVIGDLKISKKNVLEAQLAFGYDDGTWLGRGAFKLLPAGFGLDVFLGGLDDRGAMVGLDVDLPAPVPLGSTGLCLTGMGGDFAYNFVPRLEASGVPVSEPAADDFVKWAMNDEVDRWKSGPIDETAVGVAIRTDLATLFDNGWTLSLAPVGFAVIVPGPVFVLGGEGKLLKTNSAKLTAFVAVDVATKSFGLGATANIKLPEAVRLLEASGVLNGFFSFDDPGAWYLRLGTQSKPIKAKFVKVLTGTAWVDIDNHRVFLGAGLSIGGEWEAWKIKVFAKAGAIVGALVGYNPGQLGGYVEINGELGIKVWKIKLSLFVAARAIGNVPDPSQLEAEFRFKINLPWPVPDITGKTRYSLSDNDPIGPPLASPLLAGGTTGSSLEVGATHGLTGRQWLLSATTSATGIWPDAEIVVPFGARVRDATATIVSPAVSATDQGGYSVDHVLNELQLEDLVSGTTTSVSAVWAAGPGGDTAALRVLGTDPFSWLTPHTDVISHASETPANYVQQTFGIGPTETFSGSRRFGELVVTADAELITGLWMDLPSRVLKARRVRLELKTVSGAPIRIDRLVVYVIGSDRERDASGGLFFPSVVGPEGLGTVVAVYPLPGALALFAVEISLPSDSSEVAIESTGKMPLYVWAVRYLEARKLAVSNTSKTLLAPGRYRISVSGRSTADHVFQDPDKGPLPSSTPVDWHLEEEFWVRYPETLRPYIAGMSLGDVRTLGPEVNGWNPTMYGLGFPAYQNYHGVVRFKVPYLSSIFPELILSIDYESGNAFNEAVAASTAPDGTSTLAVISQDWIEASGGSVEADEEVVWPSPLPESGPAQVKIAFVHPQEGEVKLDEWTCYVSGFSTFAEHLNWPETTLTVVYDSSGRRVLPTCPNIYEARPRSRLLRAGRRIDTRSGVGRWPNPHVPVEPLLGRLPLFDSATSMPAELSAPPVSWRLDSEMVACVGPLASDTGVCFARFALLTGARFNDHGGDKLEGIGDTVGESVVEAVLDDEDRPLALWVRTPEPVDWRRVTGGLQIHHVDPATGCPADYAERQPLGLDVTAIPSPDASSAFLVANMDGVATRLPRGEFELDLWFDPNVDDVFPLRPASGGEEHVKLRFICSVGADWPRPHTFIPLPAGALELLIDRFEIPPDALLEALEGTLGPPDLGPRTPMPSRGTEDDL